MQMYDYLNADFIRGYTKAIQDIQCTFDSVQYDLQSRKKSLNYKLAKQLLQLFLEHRMVFREQDNCYKGVDKTSAFIRWNIAENTLEFYDPKRK